MNRCGSSSVASGQAQAPCEARGEAGAALSLHRRAARRDGSEKAIVEALEAVGCAVMRHSATGEPDLIVFRAGRCWLFECKRHRQPGDRDGTARLTPAQQTWRGTWRGPAPVRVETVAEALAAIGIRLNE